MLVLHACLFAKYAPPGCEDFSELNIHDEWARKCYKGQHHSKMGKVTMLPSPMAIWLWPRWLVRVMGQLRWRVRAVKMGQIPLTQIQGNRGAKILSVNLRGKRLFGERTEWGRVRVGVGPIPNLNHNPNPNPDLSNTDFRRKGTSNFIPGSLSHIGKSTSVPAPDHCGSLGVFSVFRFHPGSFASKWG